jgi:hypothetical protein
MLIQRSSIFFSALFTFSTFVSHYLLNMKRKLPPSFYRLSNQEHIEPVKNVETDNENNHDSEASAATILDNDHSKNPDPSQEGNATAEQTDHDPPEEASGPELTAVRYWMTDIDLIMEAQEVLKSDRQEALAHLEAVSKAQKTIEKRKASPTTKKADMTGSRKQARKRTFDPHFWSRIQDIEAGDIDELDDLDNS